jgi:hypothetical protein
MNNNSKNKEQDLFNLWDKAGSALNNQQQLNKENMETLLNKTSSEFSSGMKRLLKADAIFKAIMLLGLIIISAFNLGNLFVLATVLICLILGAYFIKQDRLLIEGLDELQDYKGNIIFRLPIVLSISVFLFYILGSLTYHAFQYETIRPVEDLEDALVLIAFLLFSVIFSFAVYYPYFLSRVNYLKTLLNDIDQGELILDHIDNQKAQRRKKIIITSILIVLGIIVLIALIMAYL